MAKDKEQTETDTQASPAYEYGFGKHERHDSHIGALFIIFIGIIFLLNNLNLLPWTIWNELWRFWPVILILIGLQVFLGKSGVSRIIITLLTLFILAGILAYVLFINGILPVAPGM